MTIGEMIRARREQLGITQVDLADRVNITKQLLWKYEAGNVTNIPLCTLERIADELKMDPAVLVGWKDKEDDELKEYLEELRTRPEMKMLFESSRGMTVDQVKAVVAMIEGFKK